MGKDGHDWVLYMLLVMCFVFVALFLVTSGIRLQPLDVSMKWDASGFSMTFTGIAEIIVAIAFGVGAVIRALRE